MATDDDLASAATAISQASATQPPRRDSVPPPQLIAERYEIQGLLGAGGMGRVYRAHDRTLDEIVALKLLRSELLDTPGMLERFRQEVKLARRVTSPHVVRTFDLGEHGADHFLTMEYIDGRSLAQQLDDGRPSVDDTLRIAREVAAGIAAAHAVGVLHRDLKPDNVLIARSGRIAINDFGIAMPSASPAATSDRFVGTPAYMAPEQVDRALSIGPPVDIYAFGAILFEMLTGRRPFVGGDPIQVAIARLREPPPDPRAVCSVPDALAELVLRCMAREPSHRFAHGGELAAALARPYASPAPAHEFNPRHSVPARTSRSVAILPLRAPADLADLAAGIAEEIVDTLSLTRALRVRPLASVRGAAGDADPRDIGASLGVDVIVDGSIRRRGNDVRLAARTIGVADGFVLWSSHFDAKPDDLLNSSDELVRAIASALTVELAMPERAAADPRAMELYLSAKARLRASWLNGGFAPIIADLEQALALAPADAAILATLATACARNSFLTGDERSLARARTLAQRATDAAPQLGEAWFARGIAAHYSADSAEAVSSLINAVTRTPGFAMAQAMLGSILLEAGIMEGALMHLEAAESLDPFGLAHFDLPRAYIYEGRWDDAVRQLESARHASTFANRSFDERALARYRMWRGELTDLDPNPAGATAGPFGASFDVVARVYRTRVFAPEDRARIAALIDASHARMRASRSQFMAEYLLFVGDDDAAMTWIARAVDSGLQDHLWMQKCPLLAPLHARADFQQLAGRVAERARGVMGVIQTLVH